MKIGDPKPPASDPQVSGNDLDSSQNSDNKDSDGSPFSRVLAKKRDPNQQAAGTALSQGGKRPSGDLDPASLGLMQGPQAQFGQLLQPTAVESKRAVAVPVELQQLVHEITVGVNAAGNQQVSIELNSNVLKGLHIRIERQQGAVSIQFQSTSDQVTSLLSNNVGALAEGLADRGVSVSNIRITGASESARSQDFKGRSLPSGRAQSGQQRGGR